MASSSMPEDAHDTPAAPINTPPGICAQLALMNLKLNHEWEIGEKILKGNERHAAVYSVLVSETGQPVESLEAHVFALDGIEPKLRKHRQRCIKRMKGRTKLKLEVEKTTIVVITTSQTEKISAVELAPDPPPQNNDGQQETDSCTTSIEMLDHNTLYQHESQRVWQRERRQARRSAKPGLRDERTAPSGHQITEKINQASLLDENKELSTLLSFLRELLDTWDLWRAMPFMYINPAKALEQNPVQPAAALQTIEEMESYLKVKRSEIISLRRRQANFSSAIIYNLNELMNTKREEVQHKENPRLLKDSEDRSEEV